jgi:hypothetical protein
MAPLLNNGIARRCGTRRGDGRGYLPPAPAADRFQSRSAAGNLFTHGGRLPPWGAGPPPLSRGQVCREGMRLLQQHDYQRGWMLCEARTAPGRRGFPGTLADLRNKTVLVRGEFGNGDNIMMMRYFPLLLEHSCCRRLILEASPGMETLFREYFPDCEVITAMPMNGLHPDEEVRLRIFSLPWLLGPVIGWDPIPPSPAPPALACADRRGIGLCASSVLPLEGTRARASDFEPFLSDSPEDMAKFGFDFGDRAEGVRSIRSIKNPPLGLFDRLEVEFGAFVDLRHEALGHCTSLETAKQIAGLELVVSVDTAVAHMAASLGIETWILQRHADLGACWRWSDPRWYPRNVRVFQQPRPGAWKLVFGAVAAALRVREGEIKR